MQPMWHVIGCTKFQLSSGQLPYLQKPSCMPRLQQPTAQVHVTPAGVDVLINGHSKESEIYKSSSKHSNPTSRVELKQACRWECKSLEGVGSLYMRFIHPDSHLKSTIKPTGSFKNNRDCTFQIFIEYCVDSLRRASTQLVGDSIMQAPCLVFVGCQL